MDCRRLEIIIISANNLPKVEDLKVYAKVSVAGKSETEWRTPVDITGGTNPQWKYKISYTVEEEVVQHHGVDLNIKLYSEQKFKDKYVGEVKLSLKKLFDEKDSGESRISCSVQMNDGGNGTLNISYSFGEIYVVKKPSIFVRSFQFLLASFVGCPPNVCIDVDVTKP
ncbi:Uncharacterized protein Fot_23974 [Forsythia ovata]|uniref:C2 domain-containing protein n=1 Tax=Forsythia ovata TaxID=205694 RepID=A0ABD1U4V3_9LAMI